LPSGLGLPCDTGPVTSDAGIVAGTTYEFRVEAKDANGTEVIAAAACSAVAKADVTAYAGCDPLTDQGVMQIDAASLPSTQGSSCVANVDMGAPDGFVAAPFACDAGARIGPLAPGAHKAIGTGKDAS